ncbi:Lrp/AsnC family transcriptional regulator [Paracoccus onubensis]|uniref:Lrp/AsnC family transcriptional regulator n=1 Tax=Paracoccus onubensis TaxID=1675788 RepID=UPI002731DD6C|nr:Lrp/AsnC family transcriptional regulator [Paracoccus onubensis]MDP0929688.1 Lrp/AsnC family transcriptional regulator [Paracoccus onubensis]
MDIIDRKLIMLLRHNGRRSVSDLAIELGLSRATVRGRMQRLEMNGEVLGFTVVLRSDELDLPVRGIMMIAVDGNMAERVIPSLEKFPEISEIHTTNGRWDIIVRLGAWTLADLDEVLRRIRHVPGIVGSETSLLLATPHSTKAHIST